MREKLEELLAQKIDVATAIEHEIDIVWDADVYEFDTMNELGRNLDEVNAQIRLLRFILSDNFLND